MAGPSAGTGTRVRIKVRPGASRTEVMGFCSGCWVVRIAAPPEKGRANRALLDFLAGVLGLRRRELSLVTGERSRDKIVEVTGLTVEEVSRLLEKVTVATGVPSNAKSS